MEAYSNAHLAHTRTSHLTKLYSDAKKSALTSLEVQPSVTQHFTSLHRKFRIQKDRLITWGLAWSDDEKGPEGSIDESVAKAGLTETVDSVLRNIKEVTEEAERIKAASVPGFINKAGDKPLHPEPFDEARYEDLLRDLTTSIDTLYDLSRSRKALARGELPTFSVPTADTGKFDSQPAAGITKSSSIRKIPFRRPSHASFASELTLVNPPPFIRPNLSPYAGLPPRIDVRALRLPEEGPPPYESLGVPSTTRLIGRLIRAKATESVQNALGSTAAEVPVLVEYANFDSTYRETGVPPPLQRLESLASLLEPMRAESQTNLSLLGFFEDTNQSRIGLVYDLPYSVQNRMQGTVDSAGQDLVPLSLLKLVQKANKAQTTSIDSIVPSLEDRFCIALRLTEQLHAIHSRGIAHGNINSSSVVFTTTDNEPALSRQKQLRLPLWASYDLFSKCTVEGVRRPVNLNLYRHPEDHPQNPGRSMSVDLKFDMYSLAVVLLELGLWTPLGDLYKAKYSPADFKLRLDRLWIPKLAARCGSVYMRAVQACVAAADDLDLSGSTTVIESAYETLTRNLQRCCTLDESASADPLTPIDEDVDTIAPPSQPAAIKRKPLPVEPARPIRQHSEPGGLHRTHSISSATSSVSRLSSVPNFPADVAIYANTARSNTHPALRPQSDRAESPLPEGNVQPRRTVQQHFVPKPSFKEYKRKIVLIQQKWREHRARAVQSKETALLQSKEVESAAAQEKAREAEEEAMANKEQRGRVKRHEFPEVQLPPALVDDWHSGTSVRLAKLVERALKGSPESSSISLTAYGETLETARPTFLICCTSTAKVKHVLKRHFKFDPAICDVRVKKDEIKRCRRPRRRQRTADEAYRSMAASDGGFYEKAANPDYQERPICGASIGAFRDEEHLPPVSFGGVVLVDGQAYGMSVHHMLEADDESETEDDPDDGNISDASSVRSFESVSSEPDDESTVRPPSTIPDVPSSGEGHDGDSAGIVPGDIEEIAITQPALDDAIDLDLHVDEDDSDSDSGIDEDHLLSYKLGQVHASSGLKRTPASLEAGFKSISQSLPQEIDWALFELIPPRSHPYNIVKNGKKFCTAKSSTRRNTPHSYPTAIKRSSDLACAKVHCLGRTSGLASGVVSSTMDLVKIHGRSTFSASWTVAGQFGVGGDSGAWVISNDDGKVCGHVLASRKGRTYICPMDLLLEDIRVTLGADRVALPPVPAGWSREAAVGRGEAWSLADRVGGMRIAGGRGGGNEEMGGGVPLSPEALGGGKTSGGSGMMRSLGAVEAAG
ncbi:hypothetical protein BDY17DRAFT_299018 [Neohortaea acidophila]|uniref:Protein kinase domain-containing protein n=1 Tax=Neohortaea acidophila TaxID=245834 RepID=A0A6A6PRI7_9PEZI|nr:uncharacterized protein BDY17DRAFT_299018 [Neohortaea acidophila]KAF2482699.1 hypothetical protein BDY17DRAFT_299018 [Neohortaea acidophila]